MTKWLVAAAAIEIFAIPVASAASPSKDKPKPATSAQSQSANENAAKACKAERMSLGVEAFNKKYGTNHNQRNAFGKCVSGKSKGTKDEKDEEREGRRLWRGRDGLQDGAGVHRCRCLRQEVRDEPQPEERLWQVRVGEGEGLGRRRERGGGDS